MGFKGFKVNNLGEFMLFDLCMGMLKLSWCFIQVIKSRQQVDGDTLELRARRQAPPQPAARLYIVLGQARPGWHLLKTGPVRSIKIQVEFLDFQKFQPSPYSLYPPQE